MLRCPDHARCGAAHRQVALTGQEQQATWRASSSMQRRTSSSHSIGHVLQRKLRHPVELHISFLKVRERLRHGKPRQPRHWLRLLYLFKLLLSLCKPLDFWRFDHASHSQARQHHTGDGLRCFQGMQRSFACCLDNCQLVQLVPGKPAAEVSITCNNSSTLYQGKGLYLTPSRFWI